jgi:hypothetical protein
METKPCKIFQTRKNGNVVITARAGKNGEGQIIARSTAWDNIKAVDNSFNAVLREVRNEGYEPVHETFNQ